MAGKIRVGIIGANASAGWASRAHLPALAASPDCELTAVCTTRPESAEEARRKYGAKLAFHDYRAMVVSPEIDAVAVVVRVPSHYEPTKAAIAAGKHVYTEWPLGRTTAEAEEMTALAKAKGLRTAVGLQSRVSPAFVYMKELIATGYIGKVHTCHISLVRDGQLSRSTNRMWQGDAALGANTLTIPGGHTLDALRFVAGSFQRISTVVTTQIKQWFDTDKQQSVDVTSPDNVLVNAWLASGAVVSMHIANVQWAGSGYRMEIYGSEGTLIATSEESPQHKEVRLHGAKGNNQLQLLEAPARFVHVPPTMPKGSPYLVGQMYHQFAKAIHTGKSDHPTFDTAVGLHRIIDAVWESSSKRTQVEISQ